jgi:hypothetical protein
LHKLWSHGDRNNRIHEYYFKSEERFKNFTGYFAKSGYLHKDKQHQIKLPTWTEAKEWAGVKINRFSSKRISGGAVQEQKEEAAGEPAKRPRKRVTYATKHGRCGNAVDIWELEIDSYSDDKVFSRAYVGNFDVPYETVINRLDGKFIDGYGYSFEASKDFVVYFLKVWERTLPPPPETRKEFRPGVPIGEIDSWRRRHEIRQNSAPLVVY